MAAILSSRQTFLPEGDLRSDTPEYDKTRGQVDNTVEKLA